MLKTPSEQLFLNHPIFSCTKGTGSSWATLVWLRETNTILNSFPPPLLLLSSHLMLIPPSLRFFSCSCFPLSSFIFSPYFPLYSVSFIPDVFLCLRLSSFFCVLSQKVSVFQYQCFLLSLPPPTYFSPYLLKFLCSYLNSYSALFSCFSSLSRASCWLSSV